MSRRSNPGKGAFKRCVAKVSARGGAYDPRAVCAASARRKYGPARLQRMAAAGRAATSNPGSLEFDTAKAARQYKRLVEAEGTKKVSISRRGKKHVVKWNPLGAVELLTYAQPVFQEAAKRGLRFNKKRKAPKRRSNGMFDFFGAKSTVYKVKSGAKTGSVGRHKGYTIYKTAGGDFQVPSLDSSTFDSKRDATRFIDSWVKNNPKRKPKTIPKKVLAAHARIWGGKIPAGALAQMKREFTSNPAKFLRNPVEAAREKYEEFHGRPSEDLIEVDTPMHVHDVLSGIGELKKLVILSTNGRYRVTLTKFKGTLVAQNEDSATMPQLYFEGGDQEVSLEDFGISDPVHEFEELGRMEWIFYHTVKDHLGDDGGDAIYKHKTRRIRGGSRGREKPVVIYDVRNKLLSIAGGAYTILPEGIDN